MSPPHGPLGSGALYCFGFMLGVRMLLVPLPMHTMDPILVRALQRNRTHRMYIYIYVKERDFYYERELIHVIMEAER